MSHSVLKHWMRSGLVLVAGLIVAAGCAKDEAGGTGPGPSPTQGSVAGVVVSSATGTPIAGATVQSGAATTTTDAGGQFTLTADAGDRVTVRLRAPGFAATLRPIRIRGGQSTNLQVQLIPIGASQSVSVAAGGTVAVPSSMAAVVLPANGLAPSSGTAASDVTVEVTPINPATDVNLMPGDYTMQSGSGTQSIESFGAMLIDISDAAGTRYDLKPSTTATVRIPLGTRSANPPASIPMFYLDENTARWVQEGTATLQGTGTDQYYEGTVTHFTYWNADQVSQTIQVTGCVRDAANQPVANATVQSDGIDYSGKSSTFSASDGSFTVAMRSNSRATITAQLGLQISNTVTAGPSATNITLPACLTTSTSTASLSIKLTWGQSPSDLDSHLFMPNGQHVYFGDEGSLLSAPYFANLDVDDVSGFGPEVVTATRLMQGTYRYYVHNFSGGFDPGMIGSPAKVELARVGTVHVFVPPSGEGANAWWHVFNVTIDAQCNVTIQAQGTWQAQSPTTDPTSTPTVCP